MTRPALAVFAALALAGNAAPKWQAVQPASVIFVHPQARALAAAACAGDAAQVDRLIAQGAPVDEAGQYGVTPLIWALTCDGIELPSDLSNRFAATGKAPEIKPVNPDHLKALTVLLKAGANPNRMVDGGFGPVYPGTRNPVLDGYSSVLIAAEFRQAPVLRVLLAHGGDPNGRARIREGFDDHKTALSVAYDRGSWLALSKDLPPFDDRQFENFFVLLDGGADPAQDIGNGHNVLERASMRRPGLVLIVLQKYRYTGGFDIITYNAMSRIDLKYDNGKDSHELLEFLRAEKSVDIDAAWRAFRKPRS